MPRADGCRTRRLKWIRAGHCIPNGCYREAARIFVEVTAVKPQRPRDITEADALAEGTGLARIQHARGSGHGPVVDGFLNTYEAIYGACALDQWAWAYSFKRVETPATSTPSA